MITEFACNEIGGDKAEWITQGFPLLRENYPNIRIAVWWNGVDGTWIYDIDSTEQSKEAFKEALENPYFQLNAVNPIGNKREWRALQAWRTVSTIYILDS
jgi:hypothetical protein